MLMLCPLSDYGWLQGVSPILYSNFRFQEQNFLVLLPVTTTKVVQGGKPREDKQLKSKNIRIK